ncbi:N-acetyltransferase [Aestuariivirga sp.]|uniref:N-acetyltransferase n=1 Tax=Aestuariivirga sp. TaxID=2650926 RepID=UPI00359423E6
MTGETLIDPAACIGQNVTIGHAVRIYGNVEIGDGCKIGDFSVIGCPAMAKGLPYLKLGPRATIRSHAVIYEGSTIGPELEAGHHVVIREGTVIGENLRIGNLSDIEGNCKIGDFVRMHAYAHIGKGSVVGDFVWIFSLTTLMNDPLPPSHLFEPVTVGDMAIICVNAQCLPGAIIGRGALIASGAVAQGDIPPGVIVTGAAGEVAGPVRLMLHLPTRTKHPWPRHFTDAYPDRTHERIRTLAAEINEEAAHFQARTKA